MSTETFFKLSSAFTIMLVYSLSSCTKDTAFDKVYENPNQPKIVTDLQSVNQDFISSTSETRGNVLGLMKKRRKLSVQTYGGSGMAQKQGWVPKLV